MSEHVEMYLVMTALLRDDSATPVPVSLLAQHLAISPVSANEMCRKLTDQGLVHYQPYKGVTLTTEGETMAQSVLSRRRLWTMFLVEELGLVPDEADAIACRLEHVTSERLVAALKAYLQRTPVTRPAQDIATRSLAACTAGQQGTVASITSDHTTADFLHAQGLAAGTPVLVLALGDDGTLLLDLGERRLALAAPLAAQVSVALPVAEPAGHCTWAQCQSFWSQSNEPCPRLTDSGGSMLSCPLAELVST